MNPSPLFELSRITFAHLPGHPVLRDLDLTLAAGARVALQGDNGAGKTSLLHVMVGLNRPDSGVLHAFGQRRATERDFRELRRKTGLLFQDSDDQLFCATVADDIAFGPFNLGWPRERVAAAVRDVLDRLDLAHLHDRRATQLSHGEKRLAALATLLVMAPEVLLLDEPSDGLDTAHTETLVTVLKATDAALLIVSHDSAFLERVTHTTWRLSNGRIEIPPER